MTGLTRAAEAAEETQAQGGMKGFGSLSRQIALAAVVIVAVAIIFVVMAVARYNDSRTRSDLDQKATALTLIFGNGSRLWPNQVVPTLLKLTRTAL